MKKILIVDDIEENRYLIKTYLESDGFFVYEAQNGVEALDIAKKNEIDLIISDILMPQMDGFTLCRIIKEDEKLKKIPFVFYTATYTDAQDEKLAMSLGASKFILKPKEKDEFNKLIKETLDEYIIGQLKVEQIEDENQLNYYKLYNEVLIKKLESKMIQLENVNNRLLNELKEKENLINYINQIIDFLPNPFVVLDKNFNIKKANNEFTKLFGYSKEIIGSNIFKIKDEIFSKTQLRLLLEDILKNNFRIDSYEFEIEDENFNKRIFNTKAINLSSLTENEKDIIILFDEITEFKKNIIDKQIIQNHLLHSQRVDSIGKFASGIAHDFNNILTVIINCSQNIIECINEENPLYDDAKSIFESAIKGSELTKKLLSFSRKKEENLNIIDINKIINDLDKVAKRLIGEEISIEYKLEADEPKILMDSVNFEQIMINLYSNAKDAMPVGGKIKVETKNVNIDIDNERNILPGKYIKIEISDTGKGIEQELLGKIFDPFFTTKKHGQGTGLGLYLVSSIIQQAHGYIYVCSQIGKGTSFIILLPVVQQEIFQVNEESNLQFNKINLNNVLIIDDDPFVISSLLKMLEKLNINCEKALNGKEAIKMIEEKGYKPDLIISDVILEDMSGNVLVNILKKKFSNFKEIFISGYSYEELTGKGFNINKINFIQKPFTVKDLQSKIYEVFKN